MSKIKTVGVAVGGCLGIAVLLIATLAGVLYYGFKSADATISPKIESLFAQIEDGTFADSYETETTAEFRSATSKEQYADIGKAIATRLGDLESKSLQAFKMNQVNSQTLLEVTYSAVFEKGPATILAKFEKQGGVWKIFSFRVNSKRLKQGFLTRACPKCGEACTSADRFCPACGVELPEEENARESEVTEIVDRV